MWLELVPETLHAQRDAFYDMAILPNVVRLGGVPALPSASGLPFHLTTIAVDQMEVRWVETAARETMVLLNVERRWRRRFYGAGARAGFEGLCYAGCNHSETVVRDVVWW